MDSSHPTAPSLAARLEQHLIRFPWAIFVLGLAGIGLLKVGISLLGTPAPLASFPEPTSTPAAISYGNRTLAFVFGWEFPSAYAVISLVLSATAIAIMAVLLRKKFSDVDARLIATFVILGPIGQVLMTNVGGHDAWMFLGAVVIGLLGKRVVGAAIGAVLMSLGNPEQAFIAVGCLLLVTFIPRFKKRRKPTVVAFILTLTIFGSLSMYAMASGVPSRMGYLGTYMAQGLNNFVINLPLSLFAIFGITWVVLVWLLMRLDNRERVILLVAVLLIPLIFTAITVDQTRVFVGLSSAVVFAVLVEEVPRMREKAQQRDYMNPVFWTLLFAVFLPAVVITYSGSMNVPYEWLFGRLG